MDFKRLARGPIVWLLAIIVAITVLLQVVGGSTTYKNVDLTQIQNEISANQVAKVTLHDKEQRIDVQLKDSAPSSSKKQSADYPDQYGQRLVQLVDDANSKLPASATAADKTTLKTSISHSNVLLSLLFTFLPVLFIAGLLFFMMSSMQGGGSRVMQFGKSKARLVSKDTPKTTFADVAGADEAIEELEEIKEFLASPAKFQAIGAKIPKGVLLYGPPGTGKTLLARAVAGEAGVPFYSISGSDFVEMFVGVGASRVRDLFEQAKANAPAIVFVDEIDAVGRHRGAGMGGGHDEREQTLNQLLVEMDGFDVKGGVILIAATNRPDILDPALLRPGRFDRQIAVDAPDLVGRRAILDVHAKGKPIAKDVDLTVIARRTPGFTGADLANVINEAALLTARQGRQQIDAATLEESIDRVMAGPQRRTRVMSDKEKKVTAYHEGGHALVAHALPNTAPVHKITILPRGRALGYTMVLPEEDKYSQTRSELLDTLAYALGGRAAEELVFHDPTTGAANDIEKATATARAMVTTFGMSTRLGALKFGKESGEVFLGRDMGHQRDYSEEVAAEIDEEVRGLIETAHDEAFEILTEYRDVLDDLVLKLLDKETLNKDEVLEIFASVKKRPSRDIGVSNPRRQPSTQAPVLTPAELALLGPADVADLVKESGRGRGSGGNSDGSGSRARGGASKNGASAQPRPRRTPARAAGSVNRSADSAADRASKDTSSKRGKQTDGRPAPGRAGRANPRSKPSTEPGASRHP
jgi:cell division protease FtsH